MIRTTGYLGLAAALMSLPSNATAQSRDWSARYSDNEEGREPSEASASPAVLAQLIGEIVRKVRPHFNPPRNSERIRSIVTFELNEYGELIGDPILRSQHGVSAGEEELGEQHARQARSAIMRAAPFDLPREYYRHWKKVTLTFDWKTGW